MFALPQVGKEIKVWTRTHNPCLPNESVKYYTGQVMKTFKWANQISDFCLTTGDRIFPIRVIDIRNVVKLEYMDDTKVNQTSTPAVPAIKHWNVAGSKGNDYIVTVDGNKWFCDCPAGRFNRACKHVSRIQMEYKVEETA